MKKYLRWMNLVCLDHDLEPPADNPKRDMGDGPLGGLHRL